MNDGEYDEYPQGRTDVDFILSLDNNQVEELLVRGSSYVRLQEAAVKLLLRHGYWLKRRDFLEFVVVYGEPVFSLGIKWKEAVSAVDEGRMPCDREAADILRIAASIGSMYPVHLREVIEFLSRDAVKYAVEAIMYADGFEHSTAIPRP